MNCGLANQLSSASVGPSGPVCVCSCGAIHGCDGFFQSRQCHLHIDDLFVDSLWRELRLSLTVFAGVVNVAQRITRLTFLVYVLSVSSSNPSVDVVPRILIGSLSGQN